MKEESLRYVIGTLFAFTLVSAEPSEAEELDYLYYDLGHLGPVHTRYTDVFDINDKGQIVGVSQIKLGYDRAILWENGVMTDLYGVDPEHYSFLVAGGIANDGTIVGSANVLVDGFGPIEAVRYRPDGFTVYPIPQPCTENDRAFQVNSDGEYAIGECRDNDTGDSYPVYFNLFDISAIALIVPPGIPGGDRPDAQAINNDGLVVGRIVVDGFEYYQGFLWKNGIMELIENTLGGEASPAYALNNKGTIYGYTEYGAYRLKDGVMSLLPYFDVADANDREQVVGDYVENLSIVHAVLFNDGQLIELNEFIPYSDEQSKQPTAINNYGWIIGYHDGAGSFQNISWLLVPVYPKGDYDGDDDVDLHDFGHFQECFAAEPYQGPEGGLHVGCSVFDFDDDIDLDLDDYTAFQATFTGAITSGW